MSADFVACMEDVLDLYEEPHDPRRPVVCFAETSTQLLAETRPPLPPQRGRPRREDYEYRREGTRNLFLACEPLAGWRHVAVTERRTTGDFAHQMRWLVDEAYPEVETVRVILDNLNTHRPASLYERLPRRRGPAHRKTAGVPLHAQARQLAEHGGDRVQRTGPLLPQAASPQRGCPPPGNPGLGVGGQHRPCHHQLAVQHPRRQGQTSPAVSLRFQT